MSNQVVQLTTQQLIEAIRATSGNAPTESRKTFADFNTGFNGMRDHDMVELFITNITIFKEIEMMSDEDALRTLPLLFYGLPSVWWQSVQKEVTSFEQAIEMIRSHFSPVKPAYQIYQEIFQRKQKYQKPIDTFVLEKRALFDQLPDKRHDEETQLDCVYGLLNIKYREKIPRIEITSFKDLLVKGRLLESTFDSCSNCGLRGHLYDQCREPKEDV